MNTDFAHYILLTVSILCTDYNLLTMNTVCTDYDCTNRKYIWADSIYCLCQNLFVKILCKFAITCCKCLKFVTFIVFLHINIPLYRAQQLMFISIIIKILKILETPRFIWNSPIQYQLSSVMIQYPVFLHIGLYAVIALCMNHIHNTLILTLATFVKMLKY